jgi:curved DNA-binding protein CbpA
MELTDYDILGVTQQSSFKMVKNAYHDLSRIYHPDSSQIIIGITKEDKTIAFQRIQTAYENIKKILNVDEVDLPEKEIEYTNDEPVIDNEELINNKKTEENEEKQKEFNERFNRIFEKVNEKQNNDNPYSVFYKEPEELKKNLQDSKIILKSSLSNKKNDTYEFGVNYIEDHSTENFMDIRKMESNISNKSNLSDERSEMINKKEKPDLELNKKLEELLKLREDCLNMTEQELDFVTRQRRIQREIEESKKKVESNRNMNLIK